MAVEGAGSVKSGFRPEIQALRALAVLLVVLFHLWPDRLTGGYVGVDVFFVISGYLITAHLLRELDSTGSIRLSQFYARRIRRLLPAALLVLVVTAIAVITFVPTASWRQFLGEISASAFYFVNWVLAANSVDYFAAENAASPVQHYWSLSVEEQYYLLAPLLIIVVAWLSRRRLAAVRTRWIAIAIGGVFVVSLVFSIVATAISQQFAYFATPAHAWEFAAGALLALVPAAALAGGRFVRVRGIASWAGFAVVALSAVLLDADSAFPGWIALIPVAATVVVIAAGTPAGAFSPGWLVRSAPVQFLGNISYSLYLWHWPLIVIAPFALAHELRLSERFIILAASVLLGWLTKRIVEDPVRQSRFWRGRARTYIAAAAASALVLAGSVVPVIVHDAQSASMQAFIDSAIDSGDPCFGALAVEADVPCTYLHSVNPAIGTDINVYEAPTVPGIINNECSLLPGSEVMTQCIVGFPDPDKVIVLVGDSHMRHYVPMFENMLTRHHWQFRVIVQGACPALSPEWVRTDPIANPAESTAECTQWRKELIPTVAAMTDVDLVMVSNYSTKYGQIETASNQANMARLYAAGWKEWTDAGLPVAVIADDPLTNKQTIPVCVATNVNNPDACGLPVKRALLGDPMVVAATDYVNPGVSLIDLTDIYCDDELCRVVIGGVIAYRDSHHLSTAFVRSLTPLVEPAVLAGVGGD